MQKTISNYPRIVNSIEKRLPKFPIIFYYSKVLNVNKKKIVLVNHHLSHAMSSLVVNKNSEKQLLFTLDAEGDLESGTIYKFENNKASKIYSQSNFESLGYIYLKTTSYLGMKPNQHEFKVMGLEPYAKRDSKQLNILLKKFNKLIWVDKKRGCIKSRLCLSGGDFENWMNIHFRKIRFDNIAAALQLSIERIIKEWIIFWMHKYHIYNIRLSGGIFMNVKLNQKISEIPAVKSLEICPSSGDETTVFGCISDYCYRNNLPIFDLKGLYLGNEYSNEEIFAELKTGIYKDQITFEKIKDIEQLVADLLAKGNIVARFAGREEFGARALGNRSILANPSDVNTIDRINQMIKDRDFWMPFTPSILEKDIDKYINNPVNMFSPYMAISFSTKSKALEEFSAAIHPADKTMRVQMVRKEWNPTYHKLIELFKNQTDIPGILNTSLNLHGEPNVHYPKDALKTLVRSKLDYLAIGDFLVKRI